MILIDRELFFKINKFIVEQSLKHSQYIEELNNKKKFMKMSNKIMTAKSKVINKIENVKNKFEFMW